MRRLLRLLQAEDRPKAGRFASLVTFANFSCRIYLYYVCRTIQRRIFRMSGMLHELTREREQLGQHRRSIARTLASISFSHQEHIDLFSKSLTVREDARFLRAIYSAPLESILTELGGKFDCCEK